jgi:protein-S-isoprenylcysteine O-methyltransferase Ste14
MIRTAPRSIGLISLNLFVPACDALVILAGYCLYTRVNYFSGNLSPEVRSILPVLAFALFFAQLTSFCFTRFFSRQDHESSSTLAIRFLYVTLKNLVNRQDERIESAKKSVFFLTLIKLFYIPLMLQFTIGNFSHLIFLVQSHIQNPERMGLSFFVVFNNSIYPFILTSFFFIDTVFFLFGYMIYSDSLGNEIRSVETTFLGWVTTLLCYPPFNSIMFTVFPAEHNDYPDFGSPELTFALRMIMLVFLMFYTLATINLGWKCSNLTNRGIVSKGVYAWVRHPAYAAKNLFWLLSLLPIVFYNPFAIFYSIGIMLIYVLRALTEERHLSADPDYRSYCEKVKFRFIPKVI